MPYVKISDPNIIDLGAWQQVVNVVNQHSDSINSITNNFGVQGSGTMEWNSANNVVNEYNAGPQKILSGKTKLDTTIASSTTGDHMFYIDIDFVNGETGTTAFSAKPIITATVTFGSTANNPPSTTNANVVCTVIAVEQDKFTVRLVNARSTTAVPVKLTGNFYINWMAIGPK